MSFREGGDVEQVSRNFHQFQGTLLLCGDHGLGPGQPGSHPEWSPGWGPACAGLGPSSWGLPGAPSARLPCMLSALRRTEAHPRVLLVPQQRVAGPVHKQKSSVRTGAEGRTGHLVSSVPGVPERLGKRPFPGTQRRSLQEARESKTSGDTNAHSSRPSRRPMSERPRKCPNADCQGPWSRGSLRGTCEEASSTHHRLRMTWRGLHSDGSPTLPRKPGTTGALGISTEESPVSITAPRIRGKPFRNLQRLLNFIVSVFQTKLDSKQ